MASISERTSPRTGKTSFVVQWRDPATGKGRSKSTPTAKAAQAWRSRVETQINDGMYADPAGGRLTVSDLLPDWLRGRRHLAYATQQLTGSLLRAHVVPKWGDVRLKTITRADVQRWVYDLEDQGLSSGTVRKARGVLRQVLQAAVRDDLIPKNPALDVDLPAKTPPRTTTLTVDQLRLLMEQIHSERFRVLTLFLATTGVRIGEAAALTWADIDLDRGTVNVSKAVKQGPKNQPMVGSTKTGKSRVISLPAFTADVLRDRAAAPDDHVFPNRYGRTWLPGNNRQWLGDAVERAVKIDPTFPADLTIHDLRGVAASLLAAAGAAPKAVAAQLGHQDVSITLNVYTRLRPDDLSAVGEVMNSVVDGQLSVGPPT